MSPLAAAQQAQHVGMHQVKELLARSEDEQVAIVIFGDSRSTWQRWRVPGAIYRNWDVKWAALAMEGTRSNACTEDGIGEMLYGLLDVDASANGAGSTLPGSGIVNRYPISMAEQWVRPGTDMDLWIGLHASVASTAGNQMWLNGSGAPGGSFVRGDPSQGRAVESVEYWAVANNSAPMLGVTLGMDYNGELGWPWVLQQDFGAPVGASARPEIFVRIMMGNGTTGHDIRVVMANRHAEVHQYAGRGNNWLGTRINFAGQQGCVLVSVAQGGWSISDHLPETAYAPHDNPDWKYGTEELTEMYSKCIRSPSVLLRWEVGANPTLDQQFESTPALIKESNRLAITRARDSMLAAGARQVVVEVVSYWGSQGDEGDATSRSTIWRSAMRELASEQGWAFYDQIGALRDGNYTDGNCPKVQYREDAAHQSFAGMNLLGSLEWNAIRTAETPCGTSDFNGDGDFGTDADIEAFFACLAGTCCPTCDVFGSDFDRNGDFGTDADIEAFFRVLAGRAC